MFEIAVKVPVWNIEAVCGYKPITTFWSDFSVQMLLALQP